MSEVIGVGALISTKEGLPLRTRVHILLNPTRPKASDQTLEDRLHQLLAFPLAAFFSTVEKHSAP